MRMFWKYFEMLRVQKTVNKHAINNTVSSHSGLIPSKTVDKKTGDNHRRLREFDWSKFACFLYHFSM